jgi:hypothetical protein
LFKLHTSIVPKYREKGEDKIGLIELDAFAVYSNEDIGYLLFIYCWSNFESCERISLKIE